MKFLYCVLFFSVLCRIFLNFEFFRSKKNWLYAVSGLLVTIFFITLREDFSWLKLVIYLGGLAGYWLVIKYISNRSKFASLLPALITGLTMIYFRLNEDPMFWGYSFIISVRLLWLEIERHSGEVTEISLVDFIAFVFYFPGLASGPVYSFGQFSKQLSAKSSVSVDLTEAAFRIFWGLVKFFVFVPAIRPLTPRTLLMNGLNHSILEQGCSFALNYFFIYLTFSATMDLVLAASRIAGVTLPENFSSPFKSTNLSEFWTRWHITLGNFIRVSVFFPLQKFFLKYFPRHKLLFASISFIVSMSAMSIWHGFAPNYLIYGLFQGFGLAIHLIYKSKAKLFMTNKFPHFMSSQYYIAVSWAITHAYVCFSLAFFDVALQDFKWLG